MLCRSTFVSTISNHTLSRDGTLGNRVTGRRIETFGTVIMKPAVLVPCSKAQSVRKHLEEHGLWDKTRKLQKHHDGSSVLIPVNTSDTSVLSPHLLLGEDTADLIFTVQADLPPSRSQLLVTPAQQLLASVRQMLINSCGDHERERLLREVPSHWEMHGDLVLLPASAFASAHWETLGPELWQMVAKCTRARRVARQSVVSADGFRTPQVSLLLGDNAVVQHVDNAIVYEYDLTRCMFSAGNISEKLRIAKFNCRGETVVDLYAGIGYFTLPYLVHAGASHVHACEWNPHAVAALRRNLELNHVETRCTIHPGDNRQLTLKGQADRVNLGLIPSSEEGWPVACRVLKPTGGILHVHANVNTQTAQGERHPPFPLHLQGTEENGTLNSLSHNIRCDLMSPHLSGDGEANDLPPLHFCVAIDGKTMEETQQARLQTDAALPGEVDCRLQTDAVFPGEVDFRLQTDAVFPGEVGCRLQTSKKAQQDPVQTCFAQNTNKEAASAGTKTSSLFRGNGHTACVEAVSWTNVHNEGGVCRPTTVLVKSGEDFKMDSATTFEGEGRQTRGYVGDREMSDQQVFHLHLDSSSAAESVPCSGRIPQQSNCRSDSFHPLQTELSCSAPSCERSSHPPVSRTSSSDSQENRADSSQGRRRSLKITAWQRWGDHVCRRLRGLLENEHGGCWGVTVFHTEPVKSYAPHVHHVVLDIACFPLSHVDRREDVEAL